MPTENVRGSPQHGSNLRPHACVKDLPSVHWVSTIEEAPFQMDRPSSCKRQYLKAVVGFGAIGRRFLEKSPCHHAYNPHYTKPHTALYH